MIEYNELRFNEKEILSLYLRNEWFAYTNDKESLFEGIKNSLDVIAAYDNDLLVGLIRTIGDGCTIVYIQDILILPEYQRQGIGKELMTRIMRKYDSVRQICLMTGKTEKQRTFYESLGMVDLDTLDTVGFIVKK